MKTAEQLKIEISQMEKDIKQIIDKFIEVNGDVRTIEIYTDIVYQVFAGEKEELIQTKVKIDVII